MDDGGVDFLAEETGRIGKEDAGLKNEVLGSIFQGVKLMGVG